LVLEFSGGCARFADIRLFLLDLRIKVLMFKNPH